MTRDRRLALIAGALYLLTVVTSIPALALKDPVLGDPGLLTSGGAGLALQWAALLELVLALSCIGTAVALFPVVRRVDEATALGFVAARTLEAAIIVVGILAMLSLVAVAGAADPAASLAGTPGVVLVGLHDWAFLLGPGFIPAVNALLLAPLLLRSGLVPRLIPATGLVGAALLLVSSTGALFGLIDQVSPVSFLAALPIATWEIALGVWLVVKGFRADALRRLDPLVVGSPDLVMRAAD